MTQVLLIEKEPRQFAERGRTPTMTGRRPAVVAIRRTARSTADGGRTERPLAGPAMSFPGFVACTVSTFAIVTVSILAALATLPILAGYKPIAVASDSMSPTMSRRDIVVTKPTAETLGPGAVINFRVDDATTRIHRIVEVLPEGYRTKGDANAAPDSDIVRYDDVTGFGVLIVPLLGSPAVWAASGQWLTLAATAFGLGVAAVLSIPGRYDAIVSSLKSRRQAP